MKEKKKLVIPNFKNGISPDFVHRNETASIILVEPENPDNIGAVARAMKNMGFFDLRLVKPPRGWRRRGKKMAMSGFDVLQKAREFKTLPAAISDARLVIGTSRRQGPKRGRFLLFDQAIKKIAKNSSGHSRGALVFGKESKGLDNASLALCDWTAAIPANPDYPSLNLAQAVMVFVFSLYKISSRHSGVLSKELTAGEPFVSKRETGQVLAAFQQALEVLGYDSAPSLPERVTNSLHRLLKRSGLLESEARMFKGLTRRIVQKVKKDDRISPDIEGHYGR